MATIIIVAWHIVTVIQVFLGYGTAYRLTRDGGDNGISLFGWLFVTSLAAIIPGLGFYLWHKYSDGNESNYSHTGNKPSWITKATDTKTTPKRSSWKNPYE